MENPVIRIMRPVNKLFGALTTRFLSAVLLTVISFALLVPPQANAYKVPEKLKFDLTWMGIKAGTATQEILNENGSEKIISTARSADWLSVFFPVEDRIETVLEESGTGGPGLPKTYRMKIHEGKTKRDKEIKFDHEKLKAFYVDHLSGEKKSFDIEKDTLDTLSSFYHLRSMPLEIGK